ncbi:DNA/RNA-binding protein KIN17-like [Limulus polyphemus]|uniref:DNA/RNA-binding protein KIN17-like n=1 Tax=Limulus polyphemus TaxID=6850 RepID=A0ABM1BVG8_LIMPO|nr:DNA/RNA-binding protein KIN17-like [Limulus polyphemus]
MPKHDFLTPKAIANRIKAKGLQKLRWYCQMCQKQCRDENGFKCHTLSESHQRQLLLFAENPDKYIDSFSEEFLNTFMELLKRRFGTKRIHANQVYQEYIADRDHLHMNSTQWETLTDFVKWLGREGHCTVDETEKGWFITYIDRDPETIRRQEAVSKKEKLDMDDEERMAKFLQKQCHAVSVQELILAIKMVCTHAFVGSKSVDTFTFRLSGSAKGHEVKATTSKLPTNTNPLNNILVPPGGEKRKIQKNEVGEKKKKCVLDEIMEEQEKAKERLNRKDYWLTPGLVVKIISKQLGDKYYKKKGVVQEMKDLYVGIVKMLDSGDVLKLDQAHLETVIPALGRPVRVLNGAYRGCDAVLMDINQEKFCVTVKIDSGPTRGRIVDGIKYEDISKIYKTS